MERVIVFGMTGGEIFVVLFVVTAVVSAPWWPRLGEALWTRRRGNGSPADESSPGGTSQAPGPGRKR
jgi:hypothetical protein